MGRQIQVAMAREDERCFLEFLRSTSDIQLFESFASTSEGLWVNDVNEVLEGHWSYHIWNRRFAWSPEYGRVGPKAHEPAHIGWYYIANNHAAPVLEMTRSDVRSGKFGRLYWARDFAAPAGLSYDAA